MQQLKWYKELQTSKGRLKHGYCIIEGPRFVKQLIDSHRQSICEILLEESSYFQVDDSIPPRIISKKRFHQIANTKNSQGVMAIVRIPFQTYSSELPKAPGERILFLQDIQDPGNVGTLVRSCTAFGYTGILCTDQTADPFSPKAIQASAGNCLSSWVRRTALWENALEMLKAKGYTIFAADVKGQTVAPSMQKHVLVLGNEGNGISTEVKKIAHRLIHIPLYAGSVESLNVATAGAICMYELSKSTDSAIV